MATRRGTSHDGDPIVFTGDAGILYQLGGSRTRPRIGASKTLDRNELYGVIEISGTAGAVTASLPAASTCMGADFWVKNASTTANLISGTFAGQFIGDITSASFSQGAPVRAVGCTVGMSALSCSTVHIVSDGTRYNVVWSSGSLTYTA